MAKCKETSENFSCANVWPCNEVQHGLFSTQMHLWMYSFILKWNESYEKVILSKI